MSIFDRNYYEALFGGELFPDGRPMIDFMDEFMEYQKAFMNAVSDIRKVNMFTFPVLTYSLLRKDGKFVDEEFARWCSNHNIKYADSNFFISEDVTSLSNCCRLVSDIKDLGFFNSIGGTSLEVGSVKVNTVNLARIAYEVPRDKYLVLLKERVTLCLKALDVIRHIIKRNEEKGLLPNYTYNLMKMDSQYSTIGVIGIYEALSHYDLIKKDEFGNAFYTDEGLEFAKSILRTINETKDEFVKDKDYKANVEQVPKHLGARTIKRIKCAYNFL